MRSGLQIGCGILGILCLLYYAAIVFYAGHTADFAWIWVFGGVFLLVLGRAIRYAGAHPGTWVRWAVGAAFVLAAAGIVTCGYIGAHIVGGMTAKPEKELDYVIVLGAQVRGSVPSRALRKRLDRAVQYAQENPDTLFFLSGGQGSGEDISEAEAMRRYLTEAGVDEARLICEARSTSTWENLLFCSELADIKDCRVGVLSNDFHVYRASRLAARQGYRHISCIPAPSDPLMQPHYVAREVCAVLVGLLKGEMTV